MVMSKFFGQEPPTRRYREVCPLALASGNNDGILTMSGMTPESNSQSNSFMFRLSACAFGVVIWGCLLLHSEPK